MPIQTRDTKASAAYPLTWSDLKVGEAYVDSSGDVLLVIGGADGDKQRVVPVWDGVRWFPYTYEEESRERFRGPIAVTIIIDRSVGS